MTDGVRQNSLDGEYIAAADDVGVDGVSGLDVMVQRVKLQHGVDGEALDVSEDFPLPVVNAIADALVLSLQRLFPMRALQYARDSSDRMRVSVDTGSITINGVQWGTSNTGPSFYGTGSPNSMDAREQERTQTQMRFQSQRGRWTLA